MSPPGEPSSASSSLGKRKRAKKQPTTLIDLYKGRDLNEIQDMTVSEFYKPIENMKMSRYFELAKDMSATLEAVEAQLTPTAATDPPRRRTQAGAKPDPNDPDHGDDESDQDVSDNVDGGFSNLNGLIVDELDEDSDDDPYGLEGPKYDANAPVTQTQIEPPHNFTPKCRCKAGKGKKCANCSCSKWGYRCSPETCGCREDCQNPFNILNVEEILGTSPKVKLSPCFITWILKRRYNRQNVELRQITLNWLFRNLHARAEQILSNYNEAYNAWREDWKKVAQDADNDLRKVEAMRDLISLAFDPDFKYRGKWNSYYFTFCVIGMYGDDIGTWRSETQTWHCRGCGDCANSDDWHCRKCNKCTFGQRCGGCKEVSEMYHFWGKSMKEQRERQRRGSSC